MKGLSKKEKKERTHGYGQRCGECGGVGVEGVCGGRRGYGGVHGDRKIKLQNKIK